MVTVGFVNLKQTLEAVEKRKNDTSSKSIGSTSKRDGNRSGKKSRRGTKKG